jgi:hypothetical protein
VITAQRLMLAVVEAFLLGQTLGFTAIRAIFVRRFGFVRPCPFQKRFKQSAAAAFFRAALERLVASVISGAGLSLSGPRVGETIGGRPGPPPPVLRALARQPRTLSAVFLCAVVRPRRFESATDGPRWHHCSMTSSR